MSTESEREGVVATIQRWLETDAGKVAIGHAVRESEVAADKLAEVRKIDEDLLNRPMTL